MALDPLANINQSISEVEAAQDPLSAFNRMFSEVNEGIPTNPYPVISAPIPRTTPTAVDVNQNLVGNEVTGPAPGVNNATPQGNKSFTDAALDYLDDAENWAKDEYKYGRTYSYGAGWKNMQFERYYTHPNYKKLGFSPYRDNEELYNENSTWADDWRRSTSQYSKLLSNAFGSSIFGSDDFKAAETMKEGLALGSSSKEGIGSSITNFGLSSMYTLGIGAEILAENAVLFAVEAGALALAPETLGATLPTVAAAATRQATNVGRFTKAIQGTYDFLKGLKQARNVKEFYDASKIGKAGVAAAKFLNPLENTYQFTSFLAKGEKVWTSTEKLALAAHGFGHFFKDIRMISLGVEEAGLEGAMARSEYHQKLVDEYYAKNGRMPDPGSQDAQDIYQKAASVDFTVSMANLPAIFLTNKIFFGKYLRGFPTLSSIAKTVEKGSNRYLVGVGAGKVLEKGAYEYAEKGAGRKAAEFLMSSPYLPWSREYFVTNLPEALQENLQDAISSSVIAYHEKIDKDPSVAGFWEGMSQFGTSVKGQLTGQGLETFLSGYFTGTLMGGIAGPTTGIFETIASRTKSGKAKVEAAKERRRVREEAIKDAVNGMAMDAVNVGERNATTASKVKNYMDEADKAADEGNEYKYKSAVDAAFASKAYTLAATDKTKLFTDHIDDMLTLEDEDLAKAYNMPAAEAQDVRRRLNNAKQRALDVKDTYEVVKKEYPNPVDLSLIDPKKNEDLYKKMLAKYQAHEFAIETITTSTEALRRTNGRLMGIVNEFSQASPWLSLRRGAQEIKDAGASDITALLDNYQRQRLIETLELEVDTLKEGTPEQKKKAKLKQTKIDELKKWNDIAFKFTLIAKAREEAFRNKDLDLTGVNKLINDLTSEMYPIFDKYTKLIAEEQGGTLMSKELGKAFTKVRDYHLLDSDSNAYTKALNILNDPLYFDRYISAIETAQEQLQATKAERITEGYKKFLDLKDSNDLLNAIYDQGLFVIPENVEEFLKNPRTAKFELYDIASKEPITPDNPKYEAFQNILNDRYPVEEVVTEEVETEVVEEEAPAQKAISVVDDINTMPKELQEELIRKYESLKTYFAEERPDVKFPYPSFDQFLKRSPEAKQIIEAYNKKNNLKPAPAETKAGVFTPTTPYGTPTGPELTTATKPEAPVSDKKTDIEGAKPAESKVEVISENYTPELLRANPDKLFLFGDNNTRTGKGGQAIIRDEPNAMGISTKLKPSNASDAFMSDDQLADNKAVIDSDIKKAKDRAAKEGKTIVLPKGGFGTGLAALATKAPQTFAYLNQRLQKEFGFNNTTGELVKPEAKPVEEVTTASVQEVKERLKALNEKTLIVSPSNKKVYIDSQNPEDEYKRVTNLTGDKTFNSETAATRGTIIDALLRRFIIKPFEEKEIKNIYDAEIKRLRKKHEQEQEALGEDEPFIYKEFSDNMLKNLFNVFKEVKKITDEKDLTLISDIPTLWGVLNGEKYAGTIDLLGISKKGEVYIIDLKTSGPDRRVHYAMDEFLKKEGGDLYDSIISKIKAVEELNFKEKPIKTNNILAVKNFTKEEKTVADKFIKTFENQINKYGSLPVYDYRQSDAVQQSAYAELLRQRTGITVKNIVVFPITVKETKESYISAIANKDDTGAMTMQVTVDRNLFPEQALSPEASEIVEKLEEPVEEAPEWYISPKDAVKNKILVKLGQLRDQMKIERNPDNIKKALDKIENEVAEAGLPYTEEYALLIDKVIQAIRKELKSISRVEIGDYIIFEGNPSSKFVVVNKNDKEITLYNDALPAEERVNTEPEILTNKDMYKISKIISAEAPETEELTPEEKEINVENVKAMDDFLKDDEAVKAALNNTKSKEEIEKGFLEDLDSCVP